MLKKIFSKMFFSTIIWFAIIGGGIFAVEELDNASPEYIEEYYIKAVQAYDVQDYEESLNHIRHVIKSDMNNFKLRYLAAHNHWKQGNFDSATIHFEKAMNVNPSAPGPYIDYSLMQIHLRKLYKARRIALFGISNLKKNNQDIPSKLYNILSRVELLSRNPKGALEYAEKAKSVFDQKGTGVKDKLEAVVLEARSHLSLGDYEKAEFAMLWALSIRKDSPYLHNLLGYIYMKWSETMSATDPKAIELKDNAKEHFNTALENPNLVDSFKEIILENLSRIP